jgi:methylated-DNA-[protein]-cysteine S-methyltransferase
LQQGIKNIHALFTLSYIALQKQLDALERLNRFVYPVSGIVAYPLKALPGLNDPMSSGYGSYLLYCSPMQYTCTIETPLGPMRAAAEAAALTGLWFVGQIYYPLKTDTWIDKPDYPVFASLKTWLKAYFAGNNPPVELALAPQGSQFRHRVWHMLREIPYGQTCTYGAIARRISKELTVPAISAQAIGGAVGHNRISLLIPCHRVIGAKGRLTGYAGGIEKKQALLELEQGYTRVSA